MLQVDGLYALKLGIGEVDSSLMALQNVNTLYLLLRMTYILTLILEDHIHLSPIKEYRCLPRSHPKPLSIHSRQSTTSKRPTFKDVL